MTTKLQTALILCAALAMGACDAPTPSAPSSSPSPAPNPPDVDPSETFNFPRSRILSKPSETSALVEVISLPNIAPNLAQIEAAGREYCGGPAFVGLPVSTNRMRMSTTRRYLVRCQ